MALLSQFPVPSHASHSFDSIGNRKGRRGEGQRRLGPVTRRKQGAQEPQLSCWHHTFILPSPPAGDKTTPRLENEINSFKLSSDPRERRGGVWPKESLQILGHSGPAGLGSRPSLLAAVGPSESAWVRCGCYKGVLFIFDSALSSDKGCGQPLLFQHVLWTAGAVSELSCSSHVGPLPEQREQATVRFSICRCTQNFLCVGPLVPKRRLLSSQSGPRVVVYFVLLHVFLSLTATFLRGCSSHWLASLSHLEPWEQIFYPMACAFGVVGDSFPEQQRESTNCIHNYLQGGLLVRAAHSSNGTAASGLCKVAPCTLALSGLSHAALLRGPPLADDTACSFSSCS